MRISILIPTRNGFEKLNNSINSLVDKSSSDNELEFCIKIDDDDLETINAIDSLKYREKVKYIIYDRMNGYHSIHIFLNSLYKIATGDWFLIFSDDVTIETDNWDKYLEGLDYNDILIIHTSIKDQWAISKGDGDADYYFPFLSKKFLEVTGGVSTTFHTDTWLMNLGKKLKIIQKLPLKFVHKPFDNKIKDFNPNITLSNQELKDAQEGFWAAENKIIEYNRAKNN